MNSYLLLPQRHVHLNDIPPRLMWNNDQKKWSSPASGYCGETSILSAGLLYGQYVPMYMVRQLLADYFSNTEQLLHKRSFWKGNPLKQTSHLKKMWLSYFGIGWDQNDEYGVGPGAAYTAYAKKSNSPLSLHEWFVQNGQYYCQVLPQIGLARLDPDSYDPINHVLKSLALKHEHYQKPAATKKHIAKQDTKKEFVPWMKKNVVKGYPVIIGLQDFFPNSDDPDFDHIVTVIGWGSNHALSKTRYYRDDEIVFSDHGLAVCGRQPYGGSIPYYFRYTMEAQKKIRDTGGWLLDGGCQDPDNPVFNFIQNLGSKREIGKKVCNTYHLAESVKNKKSQSSGNAGFVVQGLNEGLIPAGVSVRIHTDYYQVPVITVDEATSGKKPVTKQIMNHRLTVSGLNPKRNYEVWKFVAKKAGEIAEITSAPASERKKHGKILKRLSGVSEYEETIKKKADVALFIRVVEIK